jgi:hypothetical protein
MADKKRAVAPTFTTPRITFKFPKLNEPDTKFKKEGEFSTKVIMSESDPAVQALLAKLQPMHDKAVANAEEAFKALPIKTRKAFEAKGVTGPVVNPFYSPVYDETTEQPTGDIEMKFTLPASGEVKNGKNAGKKYTQRPAIFDAKGQPVVSGFSFKMDTVLSSLKKAGPEIWGGSEGRVTFEVGVDADGNPGYFIPGTAAAGLSLRLKAAQVIKLVSGSARDASDYGFGEEEGYAYEGGAETSESSDEDTGLPVDTSSDDNADF